MRSLLLTLLTIVLTSCGEQPTKTASCDHPDVVGQVLHAAKVPLRVAVGLGARNTIAPPTPPPPQVPMEFPPGNYLGGFRFSLSNDGVASYQLNDTGEVIGRDEYDRRNAEAYRRSLAEENARKQAAYQANLKEYQDGVAQAAAANAIIDRTFETLALTQIETVASRPDHQPVACRAILQAATAASDDKHGDNELVSHLNAILASAPVNYEVSSDPATRQPLVRLTTN